MQHNVQTSPKASALQSTADETHFHHTKRRLDMKRKRKSGGVDKDAVPTLMQERVTGWFRLRHAMLEDTI